MKTVLVAMSGGVDSSVTALLLKEEGFCPIGVHFRLHSGYIENEKRVKSVAERIGIQFCVLDYRKEFKKEIIDSFIKDNKEGFTPNPCVLCNKIVKFNLLFKNLDKFNADYLATGHYVKIKEGKIFEAEDKEKDQSYFLWKSSQNILKKTLFPLGEYKKSEVREIARKSALPVYNQPESQEICFISSNIEEFLKENLGVDKGNVVDKEGNVLGEHQGLWLYTIGQRRRIGLSGGPYYVIEKNIKDNSVIVSRNEEDLFSRELVFKNENWISGKEPKFPLKVGAKIRYRHKSSDALLEKNKIIFREPQRAITPGQSVVFYRGEEMLGGAVIVKKPLAP
ncbi:MAG: tRNA 2-thiouridine(34) synthase MnmA [Candidatus Nealsonbacteria bacterium RIFOXYB1_FULL_40_15]|uniref:tRNA-specific 2-thiouridylase MnmA n=2 Tax=Candidatus Nealsoniibacteriota TaxID=1817911 RepID=A0A1G2ELK1_9BACT|nr:MAG: tRNA 2-thiouridine(34) synthase MnmA [Candidatus Nealsonbacteria bacterium RIFOXYC1_FULL_40_7]OGZ27834.1 MAG: tRNA 2-thiouridine(34) synthase MnmA [Candidatus Nealsonbacteria bacterium RIFOXYB1_FULL_40_15]OGZ28914.1 MAG: tRNA 2-thiouridine(34) synthase MnmA [Candidatus Nealsonbacteria bacterium RIFOXYD1_FULL_39_11]